MPAQGLAGIDAGMLGNLDEIVGMRKAYTETSVGSGPQLFREDLSGVVAAEVNPNTPVRNRIGRIRG